MLLPNTKRTKKVMPMNLSLGPTWDAYITELVHSGRYASASEAVRSGLRLLKSEEDKIAWLREKVERSIARGGSLSLDGIEDGVSRQLDTWEQQQKAK